MHNMDVFPLQAVVPDPVLSTTGALVGLVVGGSVSGLIFIVDQVPVPTYRLGRFALNQHCLT